MVGITTQIRRRLYMEKEDPWTVDWQENIKIFWHKPGLFNAVS
jgi:hypothetical protein